MTPHGLLQTNRRTVLKASVAGVAFAGLGVGGTGASDDGESQFRAYWADGFNEGIYSQEEVEDLVDAATAANHNAIIAQVVRRADCFCDDAVPPRTGAPIDDGFDPLAALLEEAHDAGLEVHAWMNVNTMWNQEEPPEAEDHPFNTHGPGSDEPWHSVREDGEIHVGHNYFFDPGHPGVADYLVETATSLVENYDVDGINLDYVRYPDHNLEIGTSSWGYNEVALERFRAATGRDDVPDADDEEWAQWRRDQVTNLVRCIYLETYAIDREVCLSINSITYGHGPEQQGGWEESRTYAEVLQDWRAWMEEGIVDLNVPMNYKRDWDDDQAEMYREWNEFVADHQYDRHATVGSAIYLNEVPDTVDQIRAALAETDAGNRTVGWAGYSYATPDLTVFDGERGADEARADLEEALTEESPDGAEPVFADPASVPERTWKTEPAFGQVAGTVTTDGEPVDGLEVAIRRGGETVATTATTGNGWFGVVDLEPGRYRVELPAGEVQGRRVGVVTVDAGAVTETEFTLSTAS
ncbi:family 10 glycosylhydrolase [Natrononativus amylolyticus]|uniref:family 10 glycosylhydrolase n=1 Tax=Natrononativus amylolyticus TaxID=2963434 RepID=UPI0020CBCC8E|nr:family 10 glycosylhydrolase [Natrononativus amylolyticus]